MNKSGLYVGYAAWLLSSLAVLSWFDRIVLSAILKVASDPSGQLVFSSGSTNVYPFTYVAAALSSIGVWYYVYKAERRWWALLIGLLAARASTIAMIEVYKHIFLAVGDLSWRAGVWWQQYGNPDALMWSLLKISWLLALAPWTRRDNLFSVFNLATAYAASMAFWSLIGFPPVESGSIWAYIANAASRILSHATLVALVRR